MKLESAMGPAEPHLWGSTELPVHVFLIDDEIDAVFDTSTEVPAKGLFRLDSGLKELSTSVPICYHRWQCPIQDTVNINQCSTWQRFCADVNACCGDDKTIIIITDMFISIPEREEFNFGVKVLATFRRGIPNVWVFTKNATEAQAAENRYEKTEENADAIIERILELLDWRTDFLKDAETLRVNNVDCHNPVLNGVSLRSIQYAEGCTREEWVKCLFYCEHPDAEKVVSVPSMPFYECKTRAHMTSGVFANAMKSILRRTHCNLSVKDEVDGTLVLPFMPAYIFVVRLCYFLQQLRLKRNELCIHPFQEGSRVVALDIPLDEPQQLMGHLFLRDEAGKTVKVFLPNLLKCKPFDSKDMIKYLANFPPHPPQWNLIQRKYSRTTTPWTCPVVGVSTYSEGIQLQWVGIAEGNGVGGR